MDMLRRILENKRARLRTAVHTKPISELKKEASVRRTVATPHRLTAALKSGTHPRIIAEFKRQSPSKGMIRAGAEPAALARMYESGGATAVSVLTEEDAFLGSLADLVAVRETISLPILRKDFIFDEYQVFETAAAGADALLLIAAILDQSVLIRLHALVEELGMDALVEVHTAGEMRQAVASRAKLIGINNRDLNTFEVSLETSLTLAREPRGDALLVSESGIDSFEEMERLRKVGFDGFLIGESLMRATDPEALLKAWTAV